MIGRWFRKDKKRKPKVLLARRGGGYESGGYPGEPLPRLTPEFAGPQEPVQTKQN